MSALTNYDMILFSNSLENARASIEDTWKLLKLKDKFGHVWEITKIEFDKEFTIIRLGNIGTNNYSAIVLKNSLHEGEIDELSDWELVDYKEGKI